MSDDYLRVGLPKKINISHKGASLEITRRWFNIKYVLLTFFAILWDGFMIHWFRAALNEGRNDLVLLGSFHAFAGIYITYRVIAGYLNTTYILVNYESLTIRHKPVPYLGNKSIKSYDIKQLFSKERIAHSSKSTEVTYELHALTKEDKSIELLSNLDNSEQALFIEQEVERYIGIKDKAVRGEIPR